MRYNKIIENDTSNGEGFQVSLFVQGCPHCCEECFNPETWDFNGGTPYTLETKEYIIKSINANGIQRNLSILGGEPFTEQNIPMIADLVKTVKQIYPKIKIMIWTGYYMEQLKKGNTHIQTILKNIDYIIDGPFEKDKKNIGLLWRGSKNQRIWKQIEPNLWSRIKKNHL